MRSFGQARQPISGKKADSEPKEFEDNLFREARNATEELIENEYSDRQVDQFCSSLKKILYKQSEELLRLYYSENDSYINQENVSNPSNCQNPSYSIVVPIGSGIPIVMGPSTMNQNRMNPTMGPGMMNPMMNPGMMTPGMMTPGMMNPGMMNPGMMNPRMMGSGMMNPTMSPGMMNSMMNPAMMMANLNLLNLGPRKGGLKSRRSLKKSRRVKKEKHSKKSSKEKDEKPEKKEKTKKDETAADPSKYDLIFSHEYSGGTFQGILHELSNQCGENIVNCGIIDVTGNPNSSYNVPLSSLVNYGTTQCYGSSNQSNSFICFDFKSYAISLSAYSIRSSTYANPSYLRSWAIEGSNDKSFWKTLDSHSNDPRLSSRRAESTFSINGSKKDDVYRYIRLRSTGPSSRGNNQFEIQNIEFFGKYYDRNS